MTIIPTVIVFDVNETLSNMAPMADRFDEVGAPRLLARVWFAALLRDGFALTTAGHNVAFATIAESALHGVLITQSLNRSIDDAADHILQGFAGLGLHSDVPQAVRTLAASGIRLMTLSNGSTAVAEKLFTDASIRQEFEMLLSVENAPGWKPVRAAYEYATHSAGVHPGSMLLTAVHPWDIDGAARAGFRTAWINREDVSYPAYFTAPDITVASLDELAALLAKDE